MLKYSTKLAETTVTANAAAPVATTLKFSEATYTSASTQSSADLTTKLKDLAELKDQYGVETAPVGGTNGVWTTSNGAVISVAGDALTKAASGTATIGFVTSNGLVATIDVTVVVAP